MDALWLDYRRPRQASTGLGLLLLAISIACTAWQLYEHVAMRDAVDAAEQKLFALERMAERKTVQAPAASSTETASAKVPAVTRQEWQRLFGGIEAPGDESVTLLGVEPNDRQREVILIGETLNLATLAAYIERIEGGSVLKNVRLLSHEAVREHPARPVRFTLAAVWVLP